LKVLDTFSIDTLITIRERLSMKVFYSWQSDLPNNSNRGFIETALIRAAGKIGADESVEVVPVVDRDTVGLPGSPNIVEAILRKIDECAAFVADVSIIGTAGDRPTPNPNVLIELGYALKRLGWQRIILLQNTHFGTPERLPFDLRMTRVVTYEMDPGSGQKAPERGRLEGRLDGALRTILEWIADHEVRPEDPDKASVADEIRAALTQDQHPAKLGRLLEQLRTSLLAELEVEGHTDLAADFDKERFVERAKALEATTAPLVDVFRDVGAWGSPSQLRQFARTLDFLLDRPVPNPYTDVWVQLGRYPATLSVYAAGIAAVSEENWAALRILLRDLKVPIPHRASEPALESLHPAHVLGYDQSNWLPGMERRQVAWSDWVQSALQPHFSGLYPSDRRWNQAFDHFEYFFAILYLDQKETPSDQDPPRSMWAPCGSFLWRTRSGVMQDFRRQLEREGEEWGPIRTGLFRRNAEALFTLLEGFEQFVAQARLSKGIF
jgi:hypothetical protein